jgi:hypothetical protein
MGDEVKITDVKVAEFLAEFRERELEKQESSPIYQELVQFPQWQSARYVAEEAPGTAPTPPSAELPDPREPARARLAEDRPEPTPQPAAVVSQNPDTSRSITTDAKSNQPNPWVNTGSPPMEGVVFLANDTEVKPPWPGEWARRDGGWLRQG